MSKSYSPALEVSSWHTKFSLFGLLNFTRAIHSLHFTKVVGITVTLFLYYMRIKFQ